MGGGPGEPAPDRLAEAAGTADAAGQAAPPRASAWSLGNARRALKILRLVGFFPGHRYVFVRAAEGWLRAAFGRGTPLKAAELSVGAACQLRCEHCYATDLTGRQASLEELGSAIDALAGMGCLTVMLVGGEPTLRRDLEAVVGAARERRMVPFVFSNGLLLDAGRLAGLRAAGLFGVLFSLLGVGERHDRFVGVPGAFERVIANLRAARDAGLFVSLNVTATRDILASGDFAALVELARDLGVAFKFNYPALLGRWSGHYEQLLDPGERASLQAALALPHVSNDMVSGFEAGVCPAGHTALYVTDAGEVTPCAYIPISFGSLREEPLQVIADRMRRSPLFSRLHRVCLVGEDRPFIEGFVEPAFAAGQVPVRWTDHPRRAELGG